MSRIICPTNRHWTCEMAINTLIIIIVHNRSVKVQHMSLLGCFKQNMPTSCKRIVRKNRFGEMRFLQEGIAYAVYTSALLYTFSLNYF